MLFDLIGTLPFEPFVVDHLVDTRGRYRLDLDPQFPFAIKLYQFTPVDNAYPMNWHERLEIFVPLSGEGQFRSRHHTHRESEIFRGGEAARPGAEVAGHELIADLRGPRTYALEAKVTHL